MRVGRVLGAARLIAAVLVLVTVSGCKPYQGVISKPSEPPSMAALRELSEDHLFYPGSTTIGETGDNGGGVEGGNQAPETGWEMGTTSSRDAVLTYYQQELLNRGWTRNDSLVFQATSETLVAGWQKQRYVFRLGFPRPNDPRNPGAGQFPTVYQLTITTRN